MTNKKQNCWEFMQCGKGPREGQVSNQDICPVALNEQYNSINRGINAGRFCWVIKGTNKQCQWMTCLTCPFAIHVKQEEGPHYVRTAAGLITHSQGS